MGQPCAGNRVKEIDRYGIHLQFLEREGKLDSLLGRFPKAEYAAATDPESGLFDGSDSLNVFFVVMGGANIREKTAL
jgi:hypothetical protein